MWPLWRDKLGLLWRNTPRYLLRDLRQRAWREVEGIRLLLRRLLRQIFKVRPPKSRLRECVQFIKLQRLLLDNLGYGLQLRSYIGLRQPWRRSLNFPLVLRYKKRVFSHKSPRWGSTVIAHFRPSRKLRTNTFIGFFQTHRYKTSIRIPSHSLWKMARTLRRFSEERNLTLNLVLILTWKEFRTEVEIQIFTIFERWM